MITIKFKRDLKKKSVTRENKDYRDLLNAVEFLVEENVSNNFTWTFILKIE